MHPLTTFYSMWAGLGAYRGTKPIGSQKANVESYINIGLIKTQYFHTSIDNILVVNSSPLWCVYNGRDRDLDRD